MSKGIEAPGGRPLVVCGSDRIGRAVAARLLADGVDADVVLDESTDIGRVWRLLRRRRLLLRDVLRMIIAERARPAVRLPPLRVVTSDASLGELITELQPSYVVSFRAGLIVSAATLSKGSVFLNIHSADLPTWGGLSSIPRALRAGAFRQSACLHLMTARIDEGEVLDREPYQLNPAVSYRCAEDEAYAAGEKVLRRLLAGGAPPVDA